eukprot:TRINITY_DN3419_c0_g1_i2.p1 TRINITY_DN3419_c0_g1~~TRINITY_DN3419_c0_g1_i2.p1  ORF type:complete len:169 (-),score=19.50 TRINITY_DN3419_c0_g1_i2:112-555(-)
MPIKRFADMLWNTGEYVKYMSLLVNNFNKNAVDNVMCRDLVSVGWDGFLYDCDFNQQLGLPMPGMDTVEEGKRKSIWDVDSLDFEEHKIATNYHCFACTAGSGSSCSGVLIYFFFVLSVQRFNRKLSIMDKVSCNTVSPFHFGTLLV